MAFDIDDALAEVEGRPSKGSGVSPTPSGMATAATEAATGSHPLMEGLSRAYRGAKKGAEESNLMKLIDAAAGVGQIANKGNQDLAGLMAEHGGTAGAVAGTALGTASEFLIPTDRLGVALTPLAMTAGKAQAPFDYSAGRAASKLERGAGALMTARTSIPERYTANAIANPEVLAKEAPSMAQVSEEYRVAMDKAGMAIDAKIWKEVSGNSFPVTDKEIGRLKSLLEQAVEKGAKATPAEALIGRQAAAKLKQGDLAARNPAFSRWVNENQNKLDDFLEKNGMPEIRGLSRKYFNAATKESFDSLLPKNKNMSPNALRAYAMIFQALGGAGDMASGNIPQGISRLVDAITMSPLAAREAIKSLRVSPGAKQAAVLGASASRKLGKDSTMEE